MLFHRPHQLKVILTGGPRSGTSFLARLIFEMGYHPGRKKHLIWPEEKTKKGYLEHLKLLQISKDILKKLDADFHHHLPQLAPGWTQHFQKEKTAIAKLVRKEQMDFYKGNRLLVLSDLYCELFPEAKWIFIQRSVEATYQSRFGRPLSFEEWRQITEQRQAIWEGSRASQSALHLHYTDFVDQAEQTIVRIAAHLDLKLEPGQVQGFAALFQSRNKV